MKSCYNCKYFYQEYQGCGEYNCECSKHNFNIVGVFVDLPQIKENVSKYVCNDYKTNDLEILKKEINFREVK